MTESADSVLDAAVDVIAEAISYDSATAFTRGLARGLCGRLVHHAPTRAAVVALLAQNADPKADPQ